jgi:type II secretory pathway component PulF
VVAAVVYSLVPPFVPVMERLGDEMPLSARILLAAYPFAIVLPAATAAAGLFRPRARLLVPLAYTIGAGVLVFLLLALYVPMFELN